MCLADAQASWKRRSSRRRSASFSQATPFRLYLARVLRGAYLKKREERFPLFSPLSSLSLSLRRLFSALHFQHIFHSSYLHESHLLPFIFSLPPTSRRSIWQRFLCLISFCTRAFFSDALPHSEVNFSYSNLSLFCSHSISVVNGISTFRRIHFVRFG